MRTMLTLAMRHRCLETNLRLAQLSTMMFDLVVLKMDSIKHLVAQALGGRLDIGPSCLCLLYSSQREFKHV